MLNDYLRVYASSDFPVFPLIEKDTCCDVDRWGTKIFFVVYENTKNKLIYFSIESYLHSILNWSYLYYFIVDFHFLHTPLV